MGSGIPGRGHSRSKGPEVGVCLVWLWSNGGAGMGDSGDQGGRTGECRVLLTGCGRGLTFGTCGMAARGLLNRGRPLWGVHICRRF